MGRFVNVLVFLSIENNFLPNPIAHLHNVDHRMQYEYIIYVFNNKNT